MTGIHPWTSTPGRRLVLISRSKPQRASPLRLGAIPQAPVRSGGGERGTIVGGSLSGTAGRRRHAGDG